MSTKRNKYTVYVVGLDDEKKYGREVIAETFLIDNGTIKFINYTGNTTNTWETVAIYPVARTVVSHIEATDPAETDIPTGE